MFSITPWNTGTIAEGGGGLETVINVYEDIEFCFGLGVIPIQTYIDSEQTQKEANCLDIQSCCTSGFLHLSGFVAKWGEGEGRERGWFCASGGTHAPVPSEQVVGTHTSCTNGACALLAQVEMCSHTLTRRFRGLVLNGSRPGRGPRPGVWGPLLYMHALIANTV